MAEQIPAPKAATAWLIPVALEDGGEIVSMTFLVRTPVEADAYAKVLEFLRKHTNLEQQRLG